MAQPHVTITGFRPFLAVASNPSSLLVEGLRGDKAWAEESGVTPRFALLDTVYAQMRETLAELLEARPAALVLTGYSSLSEGLKIETRATSLCSPKFADASGFTPAPCRDPVRATANEEVDFPALIDALREAAVPAALSDDAGEYVCNHAYWHALDLIAQQGIATRAIFVHLPAIEGMDDAPEGAGAMPLDTMQRGLTVIARELAG